MKKVKYLIVIIIIFIAVFIGIELFRKVNNEETERNEINKEELIQQNNNTFLSYIKPFEYPTNMFLKYQILISN